MAETTEDLPGGSIAISPADSEHARTWPDPHATRDIRWRVSHAPESIDMADIRQLARAAEAYDWMFQIPQRQLTPVHSAIRAHLAERYRAAVAAPTTRDGGEPT